MRHRRSFAVEHKRQIVEELLSGMISPGQLTRRYEISSALLLEFEVLCYQNQKSWPTALTQSV
jgi:transposase-like protein